jgi:PKD repeat protein
VTPGVASVVSLPLEVGLMSVTSYSFQGSGVQGSNLTYTWDFGDGSGTTGQSAAHVFQLAGTYQVRLTVANSAGSASAATNVTVKSLTGRWRVLFDSGLGSRGNFDIVQSGTQLSGRFFDDIGDTPNAMIEASFLSGRDVQIRTFQQYANSSRVDRYIGILNPTADKVCGSYNVVSSFIMVRNGSAADFSNTCAQ